MNPLDSLRWSAYLAVFIAAAVEGEVVFAGACVLVRLGHLSAVGVLLAGGLGASLGDQFFFYASRGRLRTWLARFTSLSRRQSQIASRVRSHAVALMLGCRFLPGLRIAIPVACAYADIPPAQFTACSLLSSLAWASAVMALVVVFGPQLFAQLGLESWWTPIVPAVLVIGFSYWLGRAPRARTEG